jgi:hypothetical protein
LRDGNERVRLDGCVVVHDIAGQHTAMTMVGVLAETKIGDDYRVVPQLVLERLEATLSDAVGVPRLRAFWVLV